MRLVWMIAALIPIFSSSVVQASGVQEETNSDKSIEKPWDQVFEDGFKPRDNEDNDARKTLLKARWETCSKMVGKTNMIANTIASVKDNPEDYEISEEENKEQFENLLSTDNGTYQDTLNAKILELAYEHWEMGRGEEVSSPELSRLAWNWCINQAPKDFKDL